MHGLIMNLTTTALCLVKSNTYTVILLVCMRFFISILLFAIYFSVMHIDIFLGYFKLIFQMN